MRSGSLGTERHISAVAFRNAQTNLESASKVPERRKSPVVTLIDISKSTRPLLFPATQTVRPKSPRKIEAQPCRAPTSDNSTHALPSPSLSDKTWQNIYAAILGAPRHAIKKVILCKRTANHAKRQNDSRLDELASKVSALRGVTIDIYDSARDQNVIDSTVRPFPHTHPQSPPLFSSIPPTHTHLPTIPQHNQHNLYILTQPTKIVRNLLLLQHLPQRLRHTPNPHGVVGKQSRDSETERHDNSGFCAVVLDMAFDLLERRNRRHERRKEWRREEGHAV